METQSTVSPVFFKETKPAVIRIWHWMAFLFFAASVSTVLLNSTVFKTRNNISMVKEQVQRDGGPVITDKQARNVAHEYSDKLWDIHKFIGIGLSFLLLWRIIAEVAISKEKKLKTRIQKAMSFPDKSTERKHYLIVQYSYVIFYVMFIAMSLTGLVLVFEDVEWLKPVHHNAKEVHGFVQYGMYAFMVIHIFGVLRADITKYGGIVSRMINGKEVSN